MAHPLRMKANGPWMTAEFFSCLADGFNALPPSGYSLLMKRESFSYLSKW